MKTKVIEYIPRIKDAGAETLVKDYALLINKDEFDVIILCENYDSHSANYKILKENDIKIISTYGRFDYLCRILYRLFGSKFSSLLLKRKLVDLKPDVIHIHLQQLEDIKRNISVLKNVKLVYTCHNIPNKMIGSERPKEKEACDFLLKNNNLQIIALHNKMAKEINEIFSISNTLVIKNGIDFNKFKNISSSKDEKKKELGIEKDKYVIGHIGRFHEQKNHEFIIKVFNEALKKNNKSHLLLVGDGFLKDKIMQIIEKLGIKEHVTILSNRKDIPELLNTMDVFLFPSKWEGLGIVLIEAQFIGIPCVVSKNIPNEAFQSNLITKLDLSDSLENWATSCINPKSNINNYGNIDSYDMNKEIKKLENIYRKH